MASTVTLELNDETFENTIQQADKPVLIDLWAEWCAPCRVVGPIVDELAGEYQGKAVVAKLDVDQAQQTAARLGITAIPTLLIYKDGEAVEKLVGVNPKATIAEALDKHIAAAV